MKALVMIRQQPGYRYDAFCAGLTRLGYSFVDQSRYGREKPSSRDDLLVVWNLHRGHDEAYAQAWERAGGTVIVCENGYLQREDKTRYALSTHGHNGSGWFPQGTDLRFPLLGFEIQPWRTGGDYILVRDQRGIGSELMASPRGWGTKAAAKLRTTSKMPVKLMPHPGDKGKLEADLANLRGAARVHIWSSAIGVRALVEGIPVTEHAPRWICMGLDQTRETALEHMAWGQWHHEEIATGEPFARMKAEGWGPKW